MVKAPTAVAIFGIGIGALGALSQLILSKRLEERQIPEVPTGALVASIIIAGAVSFIAIPLIAKREVTATRKWA